MVVFIRHSPVLASHVTPVHIVPWFMHRSTHSPKVATVFGLFVIATSLLAPLLSVAKSVSQTIMYSDPSVSVYVVPSSAGQVGVGTALVVEELDVVVVVV